MEKVVIAYQVEILELMTCLNGCKYCYANKRPHLPKENVKFPDKNSPLLLGYIRETDKITESKSSSLILQDKGNQ